MNLIEIILAKGMLLWDFRFGCCLDPALLLFLWFAGRIHHSGSSSSSGLIECYRLGSISESQSLLGRAGWKTVADDWQPR